MAKQSKVFELIFNPIVDMSSYAVAVRGGAKSSNAMARSKKHHDFQ